MTTAPIDNRYQIIETLGRGGFGETFLVIDTHMPSGRKCVLKQLKPVIQEPIIPQWIQERFQKEAAILENLGEHHQQIPKLYAYFAQENNFYLVQEWIEGLTLTQTIFKYGNLSQERVRELLINLLPVLDYIHSRRIVHRDIKPDNIILRLSDKLPVLIDFGAVKETIASSLNLEGGSAYSVAIGTPGYMPSEQAAGRPIFSSDLYSLGMTAIFALTGKSPQELELDGRTGEILWRQFVPELHSSLTTVIDRAIRYHPRDRFISAKEMLQALQGNTSVSQVPTNVVTPEKLASKRKTISATKVVAVQKEVEEEEINDNSWLSLVISIFLVGSAALCAFLLGFNFFLFLSPKAEDKVKPTSSPETPKQTLPATPFPSVTPSETPFSRPTPKFTSIPTAIPLPPVNSQPDEPEATPTPTPEITPTPTPEITPETSPTPTVEATPEATPTPTPEITPETSHTPTPEITSTPSPSGEKIPEIIVP